MDDTNTPKLFGGKNNVANEVAPCEPWNYQPNIPELALVSKKAYKAWRQHPTTSHLVFTGLEGLNPGIRVNAKTNPVRRMHAIVVDYDAMINENACDTILERVPAEFKPTWIARSPSGFGVRLIYMFEAPIAMNCEPLLTKFLHIAHRELMLESLFAGFDKAAWTNVSTLYDVGFAWKKLGDFEISTNTLNFWLIEAAKKADYSDLNEIVVPLDRIADEVENRWPGVWPGVFEEGARGPVFWDGGQNPTSAIVAKAGMYAFSREKGFFTWAEIFGIGFVKQFQADKIGAAVDGTYFDGGKYFRKIDSRWVSIAKEDFQKYLKSRKGLSGEIMGTSSEVIDAEVFVQEQRRVHGAVPVLFDPRDLVERDGERLLNISYIKALEPAEMKQEWGENFPWLANYFDTLFDPKEQLDFFLAWLKRFYASAYSGYLERGQNIFLVGGVNLGKTLLGLRIIGRLVGGSADASDHVVRGSEFNKTLCEKALWRIDDGQVAADANAHTKFGEMVKKLAANPTLNYRAMYRDTMNNEWSGRLFVTLNDDNYSIRMVPDLTISLEEKIMVFKAAAIDRDFPPRHILEDTIERELPFFARWLLDWAPPEHVLSKTRFGVQSYIHEGLRTASLHSGQVGDLLEVVDLWIKRSGPALIETHGKTWTGSASEWWSEVINDETIKPLLTKLITSVRALGRKFTEAARIEGSRISVLDKKRNGDHGNQYQIYLNGHQPEPNDGGPSRTIDPAKLMGNS